jgi:hypothetical protein
VILLLGNSLRSGSAQWPRPEVHESATELIRGPDIHMVLTVLGLAATVPYSSWIQQPRRATAVIGKRPHVHWAAPLDREQGRTRSLHPDA